MKAAWLLVLCTCAKGGSDVEVDAPVFDVPVSIDSNDPIDAAVHDASADGAIADAHVIDAMIDAFIPDAFVPDAFVPDAFVPDAFVPDAHVVDAMVDAAIPVDAMVDAAVMVDAGCVPATTELLVNGNLDNSSHSPWVESSDGGFELITSDSSGLPAAQSAPNRMWTGGYEDGTDQVYQNVTIPANTTKLEITGYYAVGTDETGSGDYDDGDVKLIKTTGTLVEDILTLSNKSKTTGWVTFDHVFTGNYSGQSLRLMFTETNDFSNATSFFFDTLSIKATHCP